MVRRITKNGKGESSLGVHRTGRHPIDSGPKGPLEKEFMAQVVQLARLRGFLVYHTFDSRRSAEGFPDLVLLRKDRLIFAELKRDKEQPTERQLYWLHAIKRFSEITDNRDYVFAGVWTPADWPEIERILEG